MSASTIPLEKGITAQPIKLKVKVIIGAKINIALLAVVGTIISLNISFMASAISCNSPRGQLILCPSSHLY